jgi:hypothetical protein
VPGAGDQYDQAFLAHDGCPSTPAAALHAILNAVAADLARPEFRGCAFNNASVEFDDPLHVVRVAARDYRNALYQRLHALARQLLAEPLAAKALAGQLATLIDGAYTNAVHLGPDGPAAAGLLLARELTDRAAADAASAERGSVR